jgi:hypothetical protein
VFPHLKARAPVLVPHGTGWFDGRREAIAYWVFAAYAVAFLIVGRGQDAVWAAWAVPAYGAAAVMAPRFLRSSSVALMTAAFTVGVPLLILLALDQNQPAAGMVVIERSASLVLKHGTPYLGASHLSSWIAYNPYLPAMAVFGMPSAAGVTGSLGSPQVWLVAGTVAVTAAAFVVGTPHSVTACADCRGNVLRYTAFAVASPALALNLAVTTTDTPVIALMLLSLALSARPSRNMASAVALGVACAMKPTAWLAVLVIGAMLRTRDGTRAALTFIGTAFGVAVAVMLPAIIANPAAMVDNAVLFPLGLTKQLTPADSLTPGDLLAQSGPVGHALAVTLLLAAGLAVAASLVWRPPASTRAAAWRLAIGLALMFGLGPAERFGYFIYPLAIIGWLFLTREAGGATVGSATVAGAPPGGATLGKGRQIPTPASG